MSSFDDINDLDPAALDDDATYQQVCADLEVITATEPDHFGAYYAWASILTRRGIQQREEERFQEAIDKMVRAEQLLPSQPPEAVPSFYQRYANMHLLQAMASEEQDDCQRALQLLRKAEAAGCNEPELYDDFGTIYSQLALLNNRDEFMMEAIKAYLRAIPTEQEKIPQELLSARYCRLGDCYAHLFTQHGHKADFEQARECFERAIMLDAASIDARCKQALLCFEGHKEWQSVELRGRMLELLRPIEELLPPAPLLHAKYAEAFLLSGIEDENEILIAKGEALLEKARERFGERPELIAIYGLLYQAQGALTGNGHFFYKAIKACEYAVAKQPSGQNYYLLAMANIALAECEEENRCYRNAVSCFQEASKTRVGRYFPFWHNWVQALAQYALTCDDKAAAKQAFEDAGKQFELFLARLSSKDNLRYTTYLVLYSELLFQTGATYEDDGYLSKAIEVLIVCLEHQPGLKSAHYTMARALLELGRLRGNLEGQRIEGLEACQQSVAHLLLIAEADPEEENAWMLAGLAQIHVAILEQGAAQTRELKRAKEFFLQTLRLGKEEAAYQLARVCSMEQDVEGALSYLSRAVENGATPSLQLFERDPLLDFLRRDPRCEQLLSRIPR